jgi:hypothetical protein
MDSPEHNSSQLAVESSAVAGGAHSNSPADTSTEPLVHLLELVQRGNSHLDVRASPVASPK